MAAALGGLEIDRHPDLLVGLERPDDAGVYRLTDDIALVQTVDFFTPVVDDPFAFGQIAAANALSDVYAMGAAPLTAMNIVGFPIKQMEVSVLTDILRGGLDKLKEARCALVGGHSVEDGQLKYGLSVTGVVHPDKLLTSLGARAGDRLVLTKPLGTGIVCTAIKAGMAGAEVEAAAVASMALLNREAAALAIEHRAHALTDVTGFGLVGHAAGMLEGTGLGLVLDAAALPVLPGVREFCESGLLPAGLYRNKAFREKMVVVKGGVPGHLADLLWDPQTSGGLLIALAEGDASAFAAAAAGRGVGAAVIGAFVADPEEKMVLR